MPERIGNVLLDRHMRPDRVGLEHHTDVARARRYLNAVGRRRHHAPADTHAPGRGMLETGDAAQRRGLAAAGGTEHHYDLARPPVTPQAPPPRPPPPPFPSPTPHP